MARFLFGVWPSQGHIYPSLPIAHTLRAAGHDVGFVTIPDFRHLLDPKGIRYFPLARMAPEVAPAHPERFTERGGHEATKASFKASRIATVPIAARSIQQATAVWSPDVLINDPVFYAPSLVGELENIPVATLNMSVSAWPGADFGPFRQGLPPARDAETRAHYAILRARAEHFFSDVVADLNAVRAAFGLAPRQGPLPVATLSPYLQLIPTIPELDYNRTDLPPQVHYVGPCLWDPPASLDPEIASWLAQLPPDMPLVLVAASTVFTRSAGLVEAAVAGLAAADVAVLATLPFDHPLHHAPAPPRVRLARFVPHTRVLPRAAAVVTHGGFGTVTKALQHGLPLVVVPYAADQPEVAQRVVSAGAGLRLDPAGLTPAGLRAAVAAALGEPGYRAGARRLAAALARHDGPAEAAALLARLAATGQPVRRPAADAVAAIDA